MIVIKKRWLRPPSRRRCRKVFFSRAQQNDEGRGRTETVSIVEAMKKTFCAPTTLSTFVVNKRNHAARVLQSRLKTFFVDNE